MSVKLPKLQRNVPIVSGALPSESFGIWWQQVANSLMATIDSLQVQITNIQEALDLANEAKRSSARVNSYTVPTNVLSAVDSGAGNSTITIAAHTRVYPSDDSIAIPNVSILSAVIVGLNSTGYYVYYDDSTMFDTTPSFVITTSSQTAQPGAGPYRHFVGYIMTPAGGGGPSGGTGGLPPGGGGGNPIP